MIHYIGQRIALLIRHHLNLVPALLLSAGMHYGLVHYWPQPTQNKVMSGEIKSPLKIVLARQPSTLNHLTPPIVIAAQRANAPQNIERNLNKASNLVQTPSENMAKKDTYTEYLSPKNVEMPALPIVNLDLSMLPSNIDTSHLQQSLPIQLRLYIDEFGQVVRVERIGMVLAQDEGVANALEDALKKLTFTPAKHAALEVKSYQDVAFDFKANF